MPRSEGPPTPSVRVSGAPPPAPDRLAPAAPRRTTAGLVGVLGVAAGLAVLAQPPPAPPVDASLRVLPERVVISQSGVVVVPVEADNRGPDVVVEELLVRAEPVRRGPRPPAPAGSGQGRGAASRSSCSRIARPRLRPASPPR